MTNLPGETNHQTILLVEDNPDLRTATEDLLETLGYDVTAARDAAHALRIARDDAFDLVLVNAYPNHGTGLDTVDGIRAAVPGLPALLVSGFGDDLVLRQRVLAGDIGFLQMPFSLDSLKTKIDETLEQGPVPAETAPAPPARNFEPAPAPSELGARESGSGWVARSRPWLVAATVALAVGVTFQLSDRAPQLPEPDLAEVQRSRVIELTEPVGEISGRPLRLAWRAAPGSARYRVILSTVDDTTIWQTETREASIPVPRSVSDRLDFAVLYFWQVQGFAEDFSETGRSTLVSFRSGLPGPQKQEDRR